MPETAIISAVFDIFIQNCSALNCSDFSLFYDTESRFSALFIISCKKVRNLTEHRYNTCPYSINKAACKTGCQQHCQNRYHYYICLRESCHLKQKSSNSNQNACEDNIKRLYIILLLCITLVHYFLMCLILSALSSRFFRCSFIENSLLNGLKK